MDNQLRLGGGSGAAEYDAMDYTTDTDINMNEEATAIANSIVPNGVEQDSAFVPIGTADDTMLMLVLLMITKRLLHLLLLLGQLEVVHPNH